MDTDNIARALNELNEKVASLEGDIDDPETLTDEDVSRCIDAVNQSSIKQSEKVPLIKELNEL